MEQSKQITAEYVGGPKDGRQEGYVQGCKSILCSSAHDDRKHRYVLGGIVGGVARYEYEGVICTR